KHCGIRQAVTISLPKSGRQKHRDKTDRINRIEPIGSRKSCKSCLSLFDTALDREPRRIEVRERLFQLLQLRRRAMHFYPGEIRHGEHFRKQCANVVEMGENAFGVGVAFAAENFVAADGKLVEKI